MLFPSWSGPELSTLLIVGMSDVPGYRVSCYQNDTFLTSLLDSAVIGYSTIVMNSVKHGTNYCSTLYVSVKYRVMHRKVGSRSVTGGNTFIRNKIKINLIFHLCCRIALILDIFCVFFLLLQFLSSRLLLLLLLLLLLTVFVFLLSGSTLYTSTENTSKNKYT